ncbi:hypothetical protein Lal_00040036 [Lupinus albus]|nr:hypothetical protein Lal_00040036 [Lupinus albus]
MSLLLSEDIDEKVGNVDSPPALGIQLAPQGGNEESPYELGAAESEAESSSLNKKDVESSAEKVYDFDLNEPLVDEDEDGSY